MACYKPIGAKQMKDGRIVFDAAERMGRNIALPCGRCIGCRLEFSRQWALRCVHELKSHERACWFTLTYDKENLPYGGSLVKEDLQKFYRRLRKEVAPVEIRYYSCGEYGDDKGRPHYHVCLFGFDFDDMQYRRTENSGFDVFGSETLDKIWGKGRTELGDLTFETAAYTARYCTKKINGDSEKYVMNYTRILLDGTMVDVEKEFALMSRKPGIGAKHVEEYLREIYQDDSCIVRGYRSKPPRFYDKFLEETDPQLHKEVKARRTARAKERAKDETLSRRTQRQKVKEAQFAQLKRPLEAKQ